MFFSASRGLLDLGWHGYEGLATLSRAAQRYAVRGAAVQGPVVKTWHASCTLFWIVSLLFISIVS